MEGSEKRKMTINKYPKIRWNPRCNRFIVFMDIMGFKDMLSRNGHEKVLKMMEEFIKPIKKMEIEVKNRLRGKLNSTVLFEEAMIKPVIFSDSVLLISNDDSTEAALETIWRAKALINHAFSKNIPIKGALAYGELTANINRNLYFGQPLIDAFEFQKELFIYGIALHHTAENYLVKTDLIKGLEEIEGIIRYDTPLKKGHAYHYLVDIFNQDNYEELENNVSSFYCMTSGEVRQYVDNTIKFIQAKEELTEKDKQ